MRDHRNLRVFRYADELAESVYRESAAFPDHERFGLLAQIRRAAVSVPANIVERCARHSQADLLRFLDIAYGSVRELEYELNLSARLGFLTPGSYERLLGQCVETSKSLCRFIGTLRADRAHGLRAEQ
jgi:four helix bundle protein